MPARMEENRVHQGDCVELLSRVGRPVADLVFADPPFNIGYEYDEYEDRLEYDRYAAWTETWMTACLRVLNPHGSMYVAIGDEYAAEVRMIGRRLGLHLRNWIVWHYTFGQNTKQKFSRSHAHILYWVKDRKEFVFNDRLVRVPSARHTEYSDRRADPWGRIPDDTWTEFPRVCGTFREREGWHGCQMPESLLMRIVRASSNPGDLVLDPFAGSGTTLVAAAKLGRRYLGIELSKEYVAQARKRLAGTGNTECGTRNGGSEPRDSRLPGGQASGGKRGTRTIRATGFPPAWRAGIPRGSARDMNVAARNKRQRGSGSSDECRRSSRSDFPLLSSEFRAAEWPALHLETLCSLYRETNTRCDNLVANAVALDCFTRLLNARLDSDYDPARVEAVLNDLERRNRLPRLRNDRTFVPRVHRDGGAASGHALKQAELF